MSQQANAGAAGAQEQPKANGENAGGAAAAAAAGAQAGAAAAGAAAGTADNGGAAAGGNAGDAGAAAAAEGQGKESGQAGAEASGAPETYELELPEGGPLDDSDRDSIAALAKSKGWTNEQAQAALTEMAAAYVEQADRFLTETRAHAEIGGEKLAIAQRDANRVIDRFLPADSVEGKALRAGLQKSGYANWAPLVLLLARAGKAMAEDTPLGSGASGGGARAKRSQAEVLFGGSK